MVHVNKVENRITFKIKTGYYLELLTSETIKKLPGSTKSRITKDENGENIPHLETTKKVILVHNIIVNNNYEQDSSVLYSFVPNESFH